MKGSIGTLPVAAPGENLDGWPRPGRAWPPVAVFCLIAIVFFTDRQVLGLLVDPIRADIGVTDTQIGILQGIAFAVAYAFMGLPIGRLADVSNRRRLLLAGVAAWGMGTMICGLAHSFWMLFAGRMVVGIGEATLAPCALSIIGDLFPAERRGTPTSTFLTAMLAGQGMSVIIGGALPAAAAAGAFADIPFVANLAPWRATMVMLGLMSLILFTAVFMMREPTRRSDAGSRVDELSFLGELAVLRWLLLPPIIGFAMMTMGDIALMSWTPALISREYSVPMVEVGAKFGSILLFAGITAAMLGGLVCDWASKRFGPAGVSYLSVATCLIALPAGAIQLASGSNQILTMAGCWIFFSTMSGVGGILVIQNAVSNQLRGLSFSLISFVSTLVGVTIGAGLPGFVNEHLLGSGHLGLAMTLCAPPAAIIAAGCYLLAARQQKRSRRAAEAG